MRAVIFSTGDWPGIAPLNERHPAPLLPLVDRPFLQHIVERLVNQGITRFDFVLSHHPEKIEHFLGDGQRWGCKFVFHLARDAARPYRVLRTMNYEENEPLLLGHADRLPALTLRDTAVTPPLLFCEEERAEWTGWALLAPEHVATLPPDVDEAGLRVHLEGGGAARHEVSRALSFRTFGDILAAHQAVLAKEHDGLLLTGREVEPGIWLSRNVVLHPTAEVVPPVYIGEDCQIGAGVKLGPRAVVGHGCVLDTHSTVTNSLIFPGSYVGEALELADVIVDKNRLINARVGGAVTIADNFILGNLADDHLRRAAARVVAGIVAVILLLLASPVLLATALFLKLRHAGPVLHRKEVVRLAAVEGTAWSTFGLLSFLPAAEMKRHSTGVVAPSLRDLLLRFLPGLLNVVRGDLGLVGVPSRSREEIELLPHDWRVLYLRGKAGLATEASIYCRPEASEEELYAADAYYVASSGWRQDFKVLFGYLARVFLWFLYPARTEEEAER
jgi:lipopolysaccharide/colanic/teichoic acid biosynthesis glycosyltransferase